MTRGLVGIADGKRQDGAEQAFGEQSARHGIARVALPGPG